MFCGSYDQGSDFRVENGDPNNYLNGSSILLLSDPCPYPSFEESDDNDDLIYDNEDFKEFCVVTSPNPQGLLQVLITDRKKEQ